MSAHKPEPSPWLCDLPSLSLDLLESIGSCKLTFLLPSPSPDRVGWDPAGTPVTLDAGISDGMKTKSSKHSGGVAMVSVLSYSCLAVILALSCRMGPWELQGTRWNPCRCGEAEGASLSTLKMTWPSLVSDMHVLQKRIVKENGHRCAHPRESMCPLPCVPLPCHIASDGTL